MDRPIARPVRDRWGWWAEKVSRRRNPGLREKTGKNEEKERSRASQAAFSQQTQSRTYREKLKSPKTKCR